MMHEKVLDLNKSHILCNILKYVLMLLLRIIVKWFTVKWFTLKWCTMIYQFHNLLKWEVNSSQEIKVYWKSNSGKTKFLLVKCPFLVNTFWMLKIKQMLNTTQKEHRTVTHLLPVKHVIPVRHCRAIVIKDPW